MANRTIDSAKKTRGVPQYVRIQQPMNKELNSKQKQALKPPKAPETHDVQRSHRMQLISLNGNGVPALSGIGGGVLGHLNNDLERLN